jgi:hypothetical protein
MPLKHQAQQLQMPEEWFLPFVKVGHFGNKGTLGNLGNR